MNNGIGMLLILAVYIACAVKVDRILVARAHRRATRKQLRLVRRYTAVVEPPYVLPARPTNVVPIRDERFSWRVEGAAS